MENLPLDVWKEESLQYKGKTEIATKAMRTALDVMLLGEVELANQINETLYHANYFDLSADTKVGMHFAWAETNLWPDFILHPDPSKVLPVDPRDGQFGNSPEAMKEMESEASKRWPRWKPTYDEAGLSKALALATEQKEKGGHGYEIRAAVDIALKIGNEEAAEKALSLFAYSFTMAKEVKNRSRDIVTCKRAWRLLGKGILARELHIDRKDIVAYIDRVVELLNKLFNRPYRPLQDRPVSELVHLFDRYYIAAHKDIFKDYSDQERDHTPKTCLTAPATEEDIETLEEQVGSLPEDYKEFLRVSNGFDSDDYCLSCWFSPADDVAGNEDDFSDFQLSLLSQAIVCRLKNGWIEWPGIQYQCDLGRGGDEGHIFLLQPSVVTAAIATFNERYNLATADEKQRLERAATESWGSLEAMRELTGAIAIWYHWDPDLHVYRSFKELLEAEVIEQLEAIESSKSKEA